jgi:hypothetical protein
VTVLVFRTSGDVSLGVTSGGELVFSAANWSNQQAVILAAAQDADASTTLAVITAAWQGGLGIARMVDSLLADEADGLIEDLYEQFIREWGAENTTDYEAPTPTPSKAFLLETFAFTGGWIKGVLG